VKVRGRVGAVEVVHVELAVLEQALDMLRRSTHAHQLNARVPMREVTVDADEQHVRVVPGAARARAPL